MAANAEHNALDLSCAQGANQFSDLTPAQYKMAAGLGYIALESYMGAHLGEHIHDGSELAASVNWVTASAVTQAAGHSPPPVVWRAAISTSTGNSLQISSRLSSSWVVMTMSRMLPATMQ